MEGSPSFALECRTRPVECQLKKSLGQHALLVDGRALEHAQLEKGRSPDTTPNTDPGEPVAHPAM